MMIVLHTLKYGDTSLIVHGYTQEEGRVSFILRGAFRQAKGKKGSSNHGTVLLHPLSIVNYVASRSPKGSMPYLKEFSPKYRLHSIREDFDKISIAMFISELLYRTLLPSRVVRPISTFGFWIGTPHFSASLSRGDLIWISTRLPRSRPTGSVSFTKRPSRMRCPCR